MKLAVFSFKGGVGKTSISMEIALKYKYNLVTNDIITDITGITSINCTKIATNLKRLPITIVNSKKDTVFDIGAMSGTIDPKATHAISLADAIIIPTLPDRRSIEGVIQSIKFVRESCNNIFIIVNKVKNEKEFDTIKNELKDYIDEEDIFYFRDTTLFKRMAEDKEQLFENIHNRHAIGKLNNTLDSHITVYDSILSTTSHLLEFRKYNAKHKRD